MTIQILHGDCRDVLATLDECSIDAVVTDPPYGLEFMGRAWDRADNVAFRPETWAAVLRVMKPGAHLLAFGGTRTYHRLVCAIEDAGFEVRDTVLWCHGSGFPKSHNVSKGIDRAAGAERKVIRTAKYRDIRNGHGRGLGDGINAASRGGPEYLEHSFTSPATDAAREWDGWGTALKPAVEMVCLARKPLSENTVAANVLRWRTGAINIDGCRVGTETRINAPCGLKDASVALGGGWRVDAQSMSSIGRWPANLIHDGSPEVLAAFPDAPGQQRALCGTEPSGTFSQVSSGSLIRQTFIPRNDSGSAARFFYTAKADADDRLGSRHPTVKPIDLIQYLARLITPPKGTILDPFAGTGTTGEAAIREGFHAVLIECEAEYVEDILRRMELASAGPVVRRHESIKARGNVESDPGPLFAHAVDV